MATRGFEFAYNLDGEGNTPTIRDFTLGVQAEHKVGDLMLIQSDGYVDQVVGSIGEVSVVCQEYFASADVTAGTTKAKCAIITRNQVWRCSTDATSTTAVVGYTKTWDTVDTNTIDADDITNGSMTAVEVDKTDDDGNIIGYVVFSDTTFGNA